MKQIIRLKISNFSTAGFTLIELLFYVSAAILISVSLIGFGLLAIRTGTKIKATSAILNNARHLTEVLNYEIKKSYGLYIPTSSFENSPGQISLKQRSSETAGESSSFVDFYLCNDALCLKRDGKDSLAITNDQVKVTYLKFTPIYNSPSQPAIRFEVHLEAKQNYFISLPASTLKIITTANLRGY